MLPALDAPYRDPATGKMLDPSRCVRKVIAALKHPPKRGKSKGQKRKLHRRVGLRYGEENDDTDRK